MNTIGRSDGGEAVDIERRRALKKHFVSAFYNSNAVQCGFIQFQCGRRMKENRVSKPGGTRPLSVSFLIRTSGKWWITQPSRLGWVRPKNSFACLQEIDLVFSVKQSGKIDVGLIWFFLSLFFELGAKQITVNQSKANQCKHRMP